MPADASSPYQCGDSPSGYCNRLTNADLEQLDSIVAPDRRAAVANRVDKRLASAVPALPLFQRPLTWAVSSQLRGVVLNRYSVLTCGSCIWNTRTGGSTTSPGGHARRGAAARRG